MTHENPYDGFEIYDVCNQLRRPDGTGSFNRGNAFALLACAGWKDPEKEIENLEEAIYYIQQEIARIKRTDLDKAVRAVVVTGDFITVKKQSGSNGVLETIGVTPVTDSQLPICPNIDCNEMMLSFEHDSNQYNCARGHGTYMRYSSKEGPFLVMLNED